MNFISEEHLNSFLNNLTYLGGGSEGTTYFNKRDNSVYKIFSFLEKNSYSENEILRFSNIKSKAFIWPKSIIRVNDRIVGYKSDYVKAKNLYKINPLSINLDKFCSEIIKVKKDIKTISQQNISTYDMVYNNLYNGKFYIIDHDGYFYSDKETSVIEKQNNNNFDLEIYLFLIDNYFNKIVNNNKLLNDIYKYKEEDVTIFLKALREYLSELVGKEINYLREANKYIDKDKKESTYQRILNF